jgi:hypothetical protein
MNLIKSMLSCNDGSISTTRVITMLTALTVLGIYISQNIIAMTKCGGYCDFPTNSVMVLLVVMGAKVSQSVFGEKTPVTPVETSATNKPADKSIELPGGGPG